MLSEGDALDRQSCNITSGVDIDSYQLQCGDFPFVEFQTNISPSSAEFTSYERTTLLEGKTYIKRTSAQGTLSNMNYLVVQQTVEMFVDGVNEGILETEEFTFVRLTNIGGEIVSIDIKKKDFSQTLMDNIVYPIHHFSEQNGEITLYDENMNILANFSNAMQLSHLTSADPETGFYGALYEEHLFPGIDPYLFDGVGEKLINENVFDIAGMNIALYIMQFHYVQNDHLGMEIDFTLNRRQFTRFERPSTYGKITLHF